MKELPPGRWRVVRELFESAVDLSDGECEALLRRVAEGDAGLHDDVAALLASHHQAETFLELPPVDLLGPAGVSSVAEPGDRLGPYRLLREIGRGGMGTVYLAERDDGAYSMKVAVKVLAADLDDTRAHRRFHAERQLLADLDHPGIARLLDGGTTSTGRPYLVMELVDGEPIDRYCERHRLSVGARVDLFIKVCHAAQFAHQSLVVHSDLKPPHIVVDGDGQPKLVDFGIAELLTTGSEPERPAGRPESRPLTPRYASPEQLRGGHITPASDVYALGVTLYELLSGRPPYHLGGNLETMVETVSETDPLPPSAAFHRRTAEAAAEEARLAAATRSATSRSLYRLLRGDLDAIVLRALTKEPQGRFATAGELASELERYRRGEPVRTRAASLGYRVHRRLTRKRWLTAAVVVVLVAVLRAAGFTHRFNLAARRQVELSQEFGQEEQEQARLMYQASVLPGAGDPPVPTT